MEDGRMAYGSLGEDSQVEGRGKWGRLSLVLGVAATTLLVVGVGQAVGR
eukprot:CAMPEP_0114171648 /NCGR_PEP_ID=MMETSP0043_2-20121206/34811_1 /TAXON_ID=464988 /ORGANISM="Hemiselmis andersenii, Strain CCMP644" /LENGTH=48 /DNA_ID= /DNA_START= /DNA_END= /DNA_ORIENTATION=